MTFEDGRSDFGRFEVNPKTTEAAFLAQVPDAEQLVFTGPWHSYSVDDLSLEGLPCACNLFFHDGKLIRIDFAQIVPGVTRSWSDWSEARVRDNKSVHDAWLEDLLGPPPARARWLHRFVGPPRYEFKWGHMASVMDEKAGYPLIFASLNPWPD